MTYAPFRSTPAWLRASYVNWMQYRIPALALRLPLAWQMVCNCLKASVVEVQAFCVNLLMRVSL